MEKKSVTSELFQRNSICEPPKTVLKNISWNQTFLQYCFTSNSEEQTKIYKSKYELNSAFETDPTEDKAKEKIVGDIYNVMDFVNNTDPGQDEHIAKCNGKSRTIKII